MKKRQINEYAGIGPWFPVYVLIPDELKGQSHEMDNFFEGLNILISTFYISAEGFQVFQKLFTIL
jgi:hypothetical protein